MQKYQELLIRPNPGGYSYIGGATEIEGASLPGDLGICIEVVAFRRRGSYYKVFAASAHCSNQGGRVPEVGSVKKVYEARATTLGDACNEIANEMPGMTRNKLLCLLDLDCR